MPDGALQRLIFRLYALRRYHTCYTVTVGLLATTGIALSGLLLASLLSTVWAPPTFLRLALLGLFLLALTAALAYYLLRPIFYRPTLENLALRVEERFPQLSDRLISALQLQRQFTSNPEGYSLEMIDAVVYQAEKLSSSLDFKAVVDKRNLRKYGRTTGILAIILVTFALIFPGNFKFALYAFSNPLQELQEPAKFLLEVSPGNKEVVKYSDLEIGVKVSPTPQFQNLELPRRIKLFYKLENSGWESLTLKKIDRAKLNLSPPQDFDFVHIFKEVKRNLEYYVSAEGERSQSYRITVVDKPRVVELNVTLHFPAYTGLKAQSLNENEGNIKALAGTLVKIQAKSNKILQTANLVFSDGQRSSLNTDQKSAKGDFRLTKDLTYHLEVTDESGNQNPDPIEYQIAVVPDESPQVDITFPGEDRDLDESMRMPLKIVGRDDFGFTSLKIKYRINSQGEWRPEEEFSLKLEKGAAQFAADYNWSLAKLPILPGDYVTYWAEVWDNDQFSGPKKGQSRAYNLRLPTLDEIVAEVSREQSGQISQLQEVFFGAGELKKKLESLSQDLESKKGQSWEKAKEFEAALEQQKEIFRKVDEVSRQLEETLDKMVRNQLVRQEVAQKMQEIQKLVQDITTPEMKELMKKLQEALKNLDWDKIKKNMKDFQLSQEDLLKRLDQTLALLKKIQAEQKLDAMTKMLEQMAGKQEEINKKLEEMAEKDLTQLTEPEKSLQEDLENVSRQMQEFQELMQEMPLLSPEELQEMQAALNQPGNQQDIQSMSQQLGMCQKKEAKQSGEKLSSSFRQAASQFQKMAQKLSNSEQKELLAKMQKSLQDVLYLSDQQEKLADQARLNQTQSQTLRDLAGPQMSLLESTRQVSQDLEEMMKESGMLPKELNQKLGMCAGQMSQAASELSNLNSVNAMSLQNDAMGGLNEVAKSLLEAFNQTCNNPSSGMCSNPSLSQGLQSLSEQQQGVNQSTQELSNQLQEMMLPGQGQLERLAGEQAGVQKSLEDLVKEYSESANTLGKLDQLAEEIKEAVKKIEGGELDEELKQRQNKILNRLLDAQKSLYTQDYSNQRQAETGEDVLRKSPGGLIFFSDPSKSAQEEKLEQEKYPAQYEEIIRSYFKALRQGDFKP